MIILCSIVDFFFAFGNGSINLFYLAGCAIALLSLKYKAFRAAYLLFCSLQMVLLTLGVVSRYYLYSRAAAAGIVLLICFKMICSSRAYLKEN